ncbi:hypothetical protein ACQPYV_33790 [Micromonospora saelicesensis]|uniref:hypothetical protein n=1 Tax=Micromonospora saelicesensis TaxID=285676 RepID=UPI0011BDBD39|nr:hypothetical protein [Micromonospora saelicesensis]
MIAPTERGKSVMTMEAVASSSKAAKAWARPARIGLGALTVATLAIAAGATPAAASNAPLGCQTTKAVMTWTNGNQTSYWCSGTYEHIGNGRSFYAAGWSGKIVIGDGTGYRPFCDWQKIDLGGVRVQEVVLYATKFCE